MRHAIGLFCAVLLVAANGCRSEGARSAPSAAGVLESAPPGAAPRLDLAPKGDKGIRFTKVAGFPTMLTGFAGSRDGAELLVGDRQGVVLRVNVRRSGGFAVAGIGSGPGLDLSSQVCRRGEGGFFDLEVSPDDKWLLADYTDAAGKIIVARYPYRAGRPAEPADRVVLASFDHPYAWHHGGSLAFDAAGDLLVGIGDMEFRQLGTPGPRDAALLLGTVVRLRKSVVDGSGSYTPTAGDVVARGLRNPWRLSVDPGTGDVWIGDVGLDRVEEVDVIRAAELPRGPVDFGWPYLEGSLDLQSGAPSDFSPQDAVVEHLHSDDYCGVVGGFVYRGAAAAAVRGRYLYSDLCEATLRSIDAKGGSMDREVVDLPEHVVSFGQSRDGELYLLGASGGLYRMDPGWWTVADGRSEAPRVAPTTSTIPRSPAACDDIVRIVHPLSELQSMSQDQVREALTTANAELAAAVPLVPEFLRADAELIQRFFVSIAQRLAAVDWNIDDPSLADLREQGLAGDGAFTGFPEAMARIVDSECG